MSDLPKLWLSNCEQYGNDFDDCDISHEDEDIDIPCEKVNFIANGKKCSSDVELVIVHDPNYGADADGNRGIPMDFIEELRVMSLVVDGVEVDYDSLGEDCKARIDDAIGMEL